MTRTAHGSSGGGARSPRRRLPIGIQTFREIREEDCYYVDKTAWLRRLTAEDKHYFLSRPRRFGKSLLVDTLKELFGAHCLAGGRTSYHHGTGRARWWGETDSHRRGSPPPGTTGPPA